MIAKSLTRKYMKLQEKGIVRDGIAYAMHAEGRFALAVVLMLVDHWAWIIGGPEWMRWVGRGAYPLFALGVAESMHWSRDYEWYLLRLLALAVITEPVYRWATGSTWNSVWWLYLGALALAAVAEGHKIAAVALVALGALAGHGWEVLTVWLLGLAESRGLGIASVTILSVVARGFTGAISAIWLLADQLNLCVPWRLRKAIKYAIYPLHLVALAWLKQSSLLGGF